MSLAGGGDAYTKLKPASSLADGREAGNFHFTSPMCLPKGENMKIIMICTTQVVPGKMAEYLELEKKMFEATKSAEGMPSFRRLMLMSGKGDMQHTVTYLIEFDSFAAMDKFAAMAAIPEFQALMPKWDSVIETHQHDVFMETPIP